MCDWISDFECSCKWTRMLSDKIYEHYDEITQVTSDKQLDTSILPFNLTVGIIVYSSQIPIHELKENLRRLVWRWWLEVPDNSCRDASNNNIIGNITLDLNKKKRKYNFISFLPKVADKGTHHSTSGDGNTISNRAWPNNDCASPDPYLLIWISWDEHLEDIKLFSTYIIANLNTKINHLYFTCNDEGLTVMGLASVVNLRLSTTSTEWPPDNNWCCETSVSYVIEDSRIYGLTCTFGPNIVREPMVTLPASD